MGFDILLEVDGIQWAQSRWTLQGLWVSFSRDVQPLKNRDGRWGELSHHLFIRFWFGEALRRLIHRNHIPFREGHVGLGTPRRYASYNMHFARGQGRQDYLEASGNVLLFLLHGRLPWQGV